MDMKNLSRKRSRRRKGDTEQLAAQLAPLEEQDRPAAEHQIGGHINTSSHGPDPHFGAIIVDSDHLKVSTDFVDSEEEKKFLGMEPVVLVVLVVMLIFIGFVAWQISLMPAR